MHTSKTLTNMLGLLLLSMLAHASLALAQVEVSSRHVVILRSGVDEVWGNYIMALQNSAQAPTETVIPLQLPTETVDFRPEEGLKAEDIKLGENGRLTAKGSFPPGQTLVVVAFLVKTSQSEAKITLPIQMSMAELEVLTPENGITMTSAGGEFQNGVDFSGQRFDRLSFKNLAPGQDLSITLSGLPSGRKPYWIGGSIFAGLLFIGGLFLAWRSRPHGDGEAILI